LPKSSVYVTIIGNAASGKTTLSEALAKALGATVVPADELFRVNPFFPLALKDRKRWSFTSDTWFLQQRVHAVAKVPQMLSKKSVIVDSGLIMSYVYAHSRLEAGFYTEDEWKLYQALFADLTKALNLPPSSIVIYLQSDVELLLQRIKERGRDFEQTSHTREYLTGLHNSLEYVVKELKKQNIHLITVPADYTNVTNIAAQIRKT
jgi:deoxyadenosine/deoxycytidine kinase